MKKGKYQKPPEAKSVLLQTYFTSLLCMVLCAAMFLGTTYAWFTSEVTNQGNEIYIGILEAELEKRLADGSYVSLSELDADGNNTVKLYDKTTCWEPGYTSLETVKVTGTGNLAFRYNLDFILPEGTEEELKQAAKWFDVWCYHDADNSIPEPENYEQITKEDSGWVKVGTLLEVLGDGTSGQEKVVLRGSMTKEALEAEEAHVYTIALHMNGETMPADLTEEEQEAWQKELNGLMGKIIGLNVKLVATQLSSEKDAFGATYDLAAFADTLAQVNSLEEKKISATLGNRDELSEIELDTAYQFLPNETYEEAQAAAYKDYHADYVVKADKDVPADSMALAGYYQAWCQDNDDNWVALVNDGTMIEAGQELRLVELLGATVSYEEICLYGGDGIGFLCGAVDLTGENAGTTVTVELRLYETTGSGASTDVETGKQIVVGSYSYTFPASEGSGE